jgi:hypothetical protein
MNVELEVILVSIQSISESAFSNHLSSMDPTEPSISASTKTQLKLIQDLIQVIINQINGGNLSAKAAKYKVLLCLNIIQGYQLSQHPSVQSKLNQLHEAFAQMFGSSIEKTAPHTQPTTQSLRGDKIDYYVNVIKDSQSDAIYTDNYQRPPSIAALALQTAEASTDEVEPPTTSLATPRDLSVHYLSYMVSKDPSPLNKRKKSHSEPKVLAKPPIISSII